MDTTEEKTPIWRNVTVLSWAFQLTILALAIGTLAYLASNVRARSADIGIPVNFDFLSQPASFPITANDFRPSQQVYVAIWEGVLNTLRVVIVGIFLATILGVLVGVGRLSGNWLIRTASTVYVEFIRNVPVIGILLFCYLAIALNAFPRIENSWDIFGSVYINGRGLSIPWLTGSFLGTLASLILAAGAAYAIRAWRLHSAEKRNEPPHIGPWVAATFFGVLFWAGYFLGVGFSSPSLEVRTVTGGITMQPEYFALLLALVVYTASHIAEIVRGSIQAVHKGQVEASQAMALSGWQRMRYVIFPQALRIAIPPLGNQYLNLFKNSSLGFVVGYFELTKVVSTTVGTRSPAVPAYLTLMAIYLVGSLIISALMNVANRKMEIVGR